MSHFPEQDLYLVIFEVADFFKGQLSEPQSVLLKPFSFIVSFHITNIRSKLVHHVTVFSELVADSLPLPAF